ncbi:DUF1202 family protein [Shigella flexneri]
MLTSKGTPRVWLVGELLLFSGGSRDRGRWVDDIKTNNKI